MWHHIYYTWQPIGLGLVNNLIVYFSYHVGIPRKWGATPGKMLCRIAVVDDADGTRLTQNRTVARAFYGLLPFIPYLLFYYLYWPFVLSDRYDFREGTGRIHTKMENHEALSEAEQKRWHDFMVNVQEPVNETCNLSLEATGLALAGSAIFIALHPRRKSLPDVICQTLVVSGKNALSAPEQAAGSQKE